MALSSCESRVHGCYSDKLPRDMVAKVLTHISDAPAPVGPVTIYVDNMSAIDLAKNPVFMTAVST